jgi:hypothetical protein
LKVDYVDVDLKMVVNSREKEHALYKNRVSSVGARQSSEHPRGNLLVSESRICRNGKNSLKIAYACSNPELVTAHQFMRWFGQVMALA